MTREEIEKAAKDYMFARNNPYTIDFAVEMVRQHNEELQEKLKFMSCMCSKVIREAKP